MGLGREGGRVRKTEEEEEDREYCRNDGGGMQGAEQGQPAGRVTRGRRGLELRSQKKVQEDLG